MKRKKAILKVKEENIEITDNAKMQKVFYQYYSVLYKGQEFFLRKVDEY